jgi:hypothetical protein
MHTRTTGQAKAALEEPCRQFAAMAGFLFEYGLKMQRFP